MWSPIWHKTLSMPRPGLSPRTNAMCMSHLITARRGSRSRQKVRRVDTPATYGMQRQGATASGDFEHHAHDLALQGMPETGDDLLTLVIPKGGDIGHSQETSKTEVDHGGRNRSHRATLQHTQAGRLI